MPQRQYAAKEKDHFIDRLISLTKQHRRKGLFIAGAGMNAKLLHTQDGPELGVGDHIFGEGHDLKEGQGVEDDRNRLLNYSTNTTANLPALPFANNHNNWSHTNSTRQ